jgi:hypothetical protein
MKVSVSSRNGKQLAAWQRIAMDQVGEESR